MTAPRPQTSSTARWAFGIVAVIGVIQILFWLLVALGEQAVRPAELTNRPYVEYQLLGENGQPANPGQVLRAQFENSPNYNAPVGDGSPRAVFHIPFDRPDTKEPLAFFIGATPGLQEIRLNGSVLQPNVPLNSRRGAAEGSAFFYMLPDAVLKPQGNRIDVYVETQSAVFALAPFSIGSADQAAKAFDAIRMVGEILPTVAVSFLIFAILLTAVVNWPQEDIRRIRALQLMMVIWAARTWFITFATPFEVPFLVTYLVYYLLEIGTIMAFARYVAVEGTLAGRWSRVVGLAWAVLSAMALAATLYGLVVGPTAQRLMSYLPKTLAAVTAVVAVAGLILLARSILIARGRRWIEQAVLMLCLTGFVVDAADGAYTLAVPFAPDLQLTFYVSLPLGLLLGLGVVAAIAREASEARRIVVESNAILAARLVEQDAELGRSYEAQKQMMQRQVVLEERQRIVRDMHDGIGGQLLGLMMQVRGGATEAKVIEEGLQSSISDLRLIVDSMDTAEEGLAETLRSFEHRVRAQVEAAGIAFHAHHGLAEDQPGPGPRPTLQILRILQEAVTNAMRHSGASEIGVTSEELRPGTIEIRISDNGKGMPGEVRGGRGMASMRSRAEAVGGTIAFDSGADGTVVRLSLPSGHTP